MKNSSWVVAASIGSVEALKDQGVCRWNNLIKSLQQQAKTNLRSFIPAKNVSSSSSSSSSSFSSTSSSGSSSESDVLEQKALKVMDLSCWGPTTTRF